MEKLQPKLRFPEFKSNYELLLLNDITKWSSGGTPSKQNELYWNGNIPWISASTMKGNVFINSDLKITEAGLKSGSKICKKGDLLLLVRGSMLFNKIPIGMAGVDVAFNQDLKSISVNEKSNSLFLLYWFLHSESILLDMVTSTGIGAGKLDLSDLQNLKLHLPSLPEQQKIASFLTTVDDKISNLKQKVSLLEKYKKGAMQQIFSQQIGFKDTSGNDYPEWEEKCLGEVLKEVNEKSKINNQYRILSSTSKGLFNQDEYFTRDIASKDNVGYKILRKNNLVFSPQNLWLGNINVNLSFDVGLVSPSYKVFSFVEKLTSARYCYYFLTTPKMLFEYEQSSVQGASIVRRNLDLDKFLNINILLPSLEEQTKIAEFLSGIDDKIESTKLQLSKMEVWKKGLLQGMFC